MLCLPEAQIAGPSASLADLWFHTALQEADKDARYSENSCVKGPPGVRFYAGAPLIGSDGLRYGTLCVIDFKVRKFPPPLYNTLANFAELVVRELERDKVRIDSEAAIARPADWKPESLSTTRLCLLRSSKR